MKRIGMAACALLTAILLLAGCGTGNKEDKQPETGGQAAGQSAGLRVIGLKGPTTMGIVKLMKDNTQNTYEMVGTPEEAAAKLAKGDVDVALIPANLAATLSKKTNGQVKVAGINTLGVLYLVETGEQIQSMADLKGKTILSTGSGATPEYVLNYLLKENGLEPGVDVQVEYKAEAAELANALSAGQGKIALLPQPYVTAVMAKNNQVRIALDMNAEWEKVNQNSAIVTGVVAVHQKALTEKGDMINTFLGEYRNSVTYVNAHPEEAAVWIEETGITTKAIGEKALPKCNIVFIDGAEMKAKLSSYLEVLFTQNPASVGGEMPGEAFYR